MTEQVYKVRDPEGNVREIRGPAGASDEEVIAQAQSLFTSTPGGAATGNPNLMRQGIKATPYTPTDVVPKIAGATGLGAVGGFFGPELLKGVGQPLSAFPATAPIGRALLTAGGLLQGSRAGATAAGAISGAASETAGQIAEAAGASPAMAEGARFVAAGVAPETVNLVKEATAKYLVTPALSYGSKIKKELIRALVGKAVDDPKSMSEKELAYFNQLVTELRGGARSDEALEKIGTALETEAKAQQRGAAEAGATAGETVAAAGMMKGAVGSPTPAANREYADIGGSIRERILAQNDATLTANRQRYKANEATRDEIVASRESGGQTINTQPEYAAIVEELKKELAPGRHNPDVRNAFQKLLDSISNEKAPPSFQQIDETRRQLGEAFSGKPAEGYEAIKDNEIAKRFYGKLRNLQTKYAGEPQERLLADYEKGKEALQVFGSKAGKKATALDLYDDSQFATDASTLPKAYFKSRASIQQLKELTGDATLVNKSAMEFANKELAGMDGAQVRSWLGKNSEWLSEVPVVRKFVDSYATRLEGASRAAQQAEIFVEQTAKAAKEAAANGKMLMGNAFPVSRAVNLIENGRPELWAQAGPAIAKSQDAQKNMVEAVRQVVADKVRPSNAQNWLDHFTRNLRPALEQSGIAQKAELDHIAGQLQKIQEMRVPQEAILGLGRRLLLNSINGWGASVSSRDAVSAYNKWSKEKVVPE